MRNEKDFEWFDPFLAERLGWYVYALFDPVTGHPFYVGKGGGASLDDKLGGNRRVLSHFAKAKEENSNPSRTTKEIQRIWKEFGDVPWCIVRHGLATESEALSVEGAIIDLLRVAKINLTNEILGHHSQLNGLKNHDDLRSMAAQYFDPSALPSGMFGKPIFVFNIAKGVEQRLQKYSRNDPKLFREATCQFWPVTEENRKRQCAIAIGCIAGITRSVVEISDWKPADNGRWEVVPKKPDKHNTSISEALLYKRMTSVIKHCEGFWKRGGYIIFQVKNAKHINIIRGRTEKVLKLGS